MEPTTKTVAIFGATGRAGKHLVAKLFHAGLAYSPLAHDYVPTADRANAWGVDLGMWFLHLFRMPLFFVIAGFFAALLVAKRGLGGMFRNRAKRVLLPFVVFLPLAHITLSMATVHAAETVEHPSPVLAMVRSLLQADGLPEQLPGTGHLWFLYYLLFFYVLVWSTRTFGLGTLGARVRTLRPVWLLGVAPLLLVPALASVSAPHPAPESPLPQFWAFGYYGPFFAFGYLLYGHDAVLDRLRPFAPWLLAGSLVLYGVFWVLLRQHAPSAEDPSASWPIALVEAYISVWMTFACLVAGRAVLDRGNAALRYLSDASYWIYLVHLPILFAIQYRLLDLDWPWGAKFAVSTLATFAACLLSYHALIRGRRLGTLLGVQAPATTGA